MHTRNAQILLNDTIFFSTSFLASKKPIIDATAFDIPLKT